MGILKVGCPTYWGSLLPALQHTAYADALLANQFEALVREGHGGAIIPGLAKSWEFSDDFRIYRFHLDIGRKFSNGKSLSPEVVKRAWEMGLSFPAESSNSSLQDVLYLVKGFLDFPRSNELSGVTVVDPETIQIEFTKPFRTALSEFATGRMSIFIQEGQEAIGTGPYVIRHESESILVMQKNPYFEKPVGFEMVRVIVVPPENINSALRSGEIDIYAFADRAALKTCESAEVACFAGMESGHSVVIPNGMSGRFFENERFRLALQFLIHKKIRIEELPSNYRRNLDIDPQVYLKLQPGRLRESEVQELINGGGAYVDEMIAASHKRPLYLVTSEMNNWIQTLLENAGVKFSATSGVVETKDRVRMYYKTFEPDLFVSGTSVASGDPDGLFHILAKDGAITSPVLLRKGVSDLLELGRAIVDISKLDSHYSQVSRQVLRDVPFVHIGFIRGLFAYNRSKVLVNEGLRNRESGQFTLFSPK